LRIRRRRSSVGVTGAPWLPVDGQPERGGEVSRWQVGGVSWAYTSWRESLQGSSALAPFEGGCPTGGGLCDLRQLRGRHAPLPPHRHGAARRHSSASSWQRSVSAGAGRAASKELADEPDGLR